MIMRGRSTKCCSSGNQTYGRSKSQNKKHLKCYHCGKREHVKKDCWQGRMKEKTLKQPHKVVLQVP